MKLPSPRGPVSALVFGWLRDDAGRSLQEALAVVDGLPESADCLHDDDLQATLWTLYELHYGGFTDVADELEWHPPLIQIRNALQRSFERQLRAHTQQEVTELAAGPHSALPKRLAGFIENFESPSAATYLQRQATHDQLREYLIHRTIYHLKEADPHTWTIPRLTGPPKVALAEIQYDEYGSGRPHRQHATMFADTLTACGLDSDYGAYFDQVPAITLAVNNMLSMFGLNRRLRGASMGHLAAFEATSSLPSKRIARALHRLQFPPIAAAYYDEHVEADAVHEQVALFDICGRLAVTQPDLIEDICFGMASCLHLEGLAAGYLVERWDGGVSALRSARGEEQNSSLSAAVVA
ncbi:MAG: iron-containing redox enzyme family protein [Nocardioidaceae bacterium]